MVFLPPPAPPGIGRASAYTRYVLTAQRQWRRRSVPDDVVAELEHELGMSPLLARLMALRGVQGLVAAEAFLARRLSDLHKPTALRDCDAAARHLASAIADRKPILVHGDYDVDGSTAASLLVQFCRACGHDATAWIPDRRIDGYGLGEASLQAAIAMQPAVMITVDCGIADHGFARRIEQEANCILIITDHHLPQGDLPDCTAVVNPNHPACSYPEKGLAGVGVAWKLAWATATILSGSDKVSPRLRDFLLDALALVAVGTICDCAPLTGENRILVAHGLRALSKTTNPGLRALLEQAKLEGPLSASDIGWRIGPLLNASGRVGSAMANIGLLTATDPQVARKLLISIVGENEERKRLTQILTDDLFAAAAADPQLDRRNTLVFAGEGWHAGVVGIVASRLTERYGKPSAVIALENGVGKGSLRSIAGVHLGEALDACRHLLIKGGGHAMAAGLSIAAASVAGFKDAFELHVSSRLAPGALDLRTDHDGEAAVAELDADFFTDLERLGPFGIGNPEPVLHLRSVAPVARPRMFGRDGDHLKMAITDAGGSMRELLAWKAKDRYAAFATPGIRFDLLVRPEANRWRGELQPRLVLVDGRSA